MAHAAPCTCVRVTSYRSCTGPWYFPGKHSEDRDLGTVLSKAFYRMSRFINTTVPKSCWKLFTRKRFISILLELSLSPFVLWLIKNSREFSMLGMLLCSLNNVVNGDVRSSDSSVSIFPSCYLWDSEGVCSSYRGGNGYIYLQFAVVVQLLSTRLAPHRFSRCLAMPVQLQSDVPLNILPPFCAVWDYLWYFHT